MIAGQVYLNQEKFIFFKHIKGNFNIKRHWKFPEETSRFSNFKFNLDKVFLWNLSREK